MFNPTHPLRYFTGKVRQIVLTLFACGSLSACAYLEEFLPEGSTETRVLPAEINFTRPTLHPEGVDYSGQQERFFVSSLRFGNVGAVSPDGTYTEFVNDESLISTIGLRVDAIRKRLLVAVSDPGANRERSSAATQGRTAKLGIYSLTDGSRIHLVDLGALRPGAGHFANDIAVDPIGNAYITDSFSPVIYKVDRQGNPTVLVENARFATPSGAFGLNGIVYHPKGFLIVGFSRENRLFKVSLTSPATISEIKLDATLIGPDGLLLSNNGKRLVVVNNAGGSAASKVVAFDTSDDWATGEAVAEFAPGPVFPTTATTNGKDIYVLHAYLNKLLSGDLSQQTFTIQKVSFPIR